MSFNCFSCVCVREMAFVEAMSIDQSNRVPKLLHTTTAIVSVSTTEFICLEMTQSGSALQSKLHFWDLADAF